MSVGITVIQEAPSAHIAAGNGFAIGQYIEELQAQGYSFSYIQQTLKREGLSLALSSEEPATCKQIEDALKGLDRNAAAASLEAFKSNHAITRSGRNRQLQCLRMRVESRYGVDSDVYRMLMEILRG